LETQPWKQQQNIKKNYFKKLIKIFRENEEKKHRHAMYRDHTNENKNLKGGHQIAIYISSGVVRKSPPQTDTRA
jgi:hypothetical protein